MFVDPEVVKKFGVKKDWKEKFYGRRITVFMTKFGEVAADATDEDVYARILKEIASGDITSVEFYDMSDAIDATAPFIVRLLSRIKLRYLTFHSFTDKNHNPHSFGFSKAHAEWLVAHKQGVSMEDEFFDEMEAEGIFCGVEGCTVPFREHTFELFAVYSLPQDMEGVPDEALREDLAFLYELFGVLALNVKGILVIIEGTDEATWTSALQGCLDRVPDGILRL